MGKARRVCTALIHGIPHHDGSSETPLDVQFVEAFIKRNSSDSGRPSTTDHASIVAGRFRWATTIIWEIATKTVWKPFTGVQKQKWTAEWV